MRLRIGLDHLQSRCPEHQVLHLQSDRQILAILYGTTNEGHLIWEPRVTDYDFLLPINAVGFERANLVAVVEQHGEQARSLMPLVFDDQGPKIRDVAVLSPIDLIVNSEISLSIDVDDEGLSGTKRVEAAVDVHRTGEFEADLKPVLAQQADNGRWIVQIPTEGLPAGTTNLLIRGYDAVGNIGPIFSKPITLLAPEEAALRRMARNPSIVGKVVYVDQEVAEAEITLTPVKPESSDSSSDDLRTPLSTKTDKHGAFVVVGVSPGDWTIDVTGSVRGFRYQQQWPLSVVLDPPPEALHLDLGRRPTKAKTKTP
ncbi:MAG: hypothetical protein KDA84_22895, partial [Planctomycetaceae bacterium]|nr:hypothetical protein [Planctomycetaceae bacterium]